MINEAAALTQRIDALENAVRTLKDWHWRKNFCSVYTILVTIVSSQTYFNQNDDSVSTFNQQSPLRLRSGFCLLARLDLVVHATCHLLGIKTNNMLNYERHCQVGERYRQIETSCQSRDS
eukprot:2105673-Amphidinium_carterae.1